MRKLLAVISREYVTRVRTKAFVIGTFIGPLILGVLFTLPTALEKGASGAKRIVVLDEATGKFAERVVARLDEARASGAPDAPALYDARRVGAGARHAAMRDSLVRLIGHDGAGGLDGLVVLADSTLETGRVEYLGENAGSPRDMAALHQMLEAAVTTERLERAGVDRSVLERALTPLDLRTVQVSKGRATGESGQSSFLLAYAMSFILYLALLLYGVQVMSSVVEEKSSRVIEVLVSSVSPIELLLGKMLGVGAVGLTQLYIWAGTAMALTTFRVPIAKLFGMHASSVARLPIPTVSPQLLIVFLVFFLLGFFLYAALYAGVGAMCNSMNEAQQANMPVSMCIAGGLLCMFALLSQPSGPLAKTLSLIPFVAPFVVPVRYSFSAITTGEMVISGLSTFFGVVVLTWIAARIYRVGILSYGKRASVREVWRWVRVG
jgi:ABC-2 type transport system permease protein